MKPIYKIILTLSFWLLGSDFIDAQVNLVYNGYFEIYSQCPNNAGQINLAAGWFAAGGTPEYNNSCNNSNVSVPNAHDGYQQDCCGGNGYAGEYMICNETTPGDDNCREYIGTQLTDTLKAGHKYLASMYVNRSNEWNYSIATIGMLFTDTAIILPNQAYGPPLYTTPQIKNTGLLSDTLNWILVKDTFTAIGHEVYLTIGNFNSTATSDTVMSPGGFGTWGAFGSAYYYIDGVSVYDVATLGIEQNKNKEIEISVYPNPGTDKLYIETKEDIKEIKLYDILGKEQLSAIKEEIDVSTIPNGIYFLKAETGVGVLTKKILVQH